MFDWRIIVHHRPRLGLQASVTERPIVLPPAAGEEHMPSKRDDYWRHHQQCTDLAKSAVTAEHSALWITAAAGWRFLIEREDRLAAEATEDDRRLFSLRP